LTYHHTPACISSPKAQIISRRLHYRRLDLIAEKWYNQFNKLDIAAILQKYVVA